jgi:hypothetical protein
MSIVSYTLDTLPPPTAEDMARLKAVAEMPDSEIDFSDIPRITDEMWDRSMTLEEARAFRAARKQEAVEA